MGQGNPEQKNDEEMGWYGKNISPQVHKVIRNKKRGKKRECMIGLSRWYVVGGGATLGPKVALAPPEYLKKLVYI